MLNPPLPQNRLKKHKVIDQQEACKVKENRWSRFEKFLEKMKKSIQ